MGLLELRALGYRTDGKEILNGLSLSVEPSGGGYALVPSFIYFLRAPVKLAIGTSMAAFVWMALVGSFFKLYQNVVNIPVAATLGVGAAIGAVYGAKLVQKFNPNVLKTLFGLLFMYVSLKYILIYFGIHI